MNGDHVAVVKEEDNEDNTDESEDEKPVRAKKSGRKSVSKKQINVRLENQI